MSKKDLDDRITTLEIEIAQLRKERDAIPTTVSLQFSINDVRGVLVRAWGVFRGESLLSQRWRRVPDTAGAFEYELALTEHDDGAAWAHGVLADLRAHALTPDVDTLTALEDLRVSLTSLQRRVHAVLVVLREEPSR